MQHLLSTIELKSGPTPSSPHLCLQPPTVTLFVGPNHSGKSLLLREIRDEFSRAEPTTHGKLLSRLGFNALDTASQRKLREELLTGQEFLQGNQPFINLQFGNGGNHHVPKARFDALLDRLDDVAFLRMQLQPWGQNRINRLSLLLDGTQRLALLAETARGNLRGPLGSIHGVLFQNDEKRKEFQKIIKDAFGWYFVVDPTGESTFRIAVSDTPPPNNIERSLSQDALNFFASCAGIETTSDGVRAFSGMAAAVIVSEAKVILIDEPEAFLHPALTASLAKELCKQAAKNDLQLIVSTHSAPFVMGCVQAGIPLSIARLTYRNGVATSRILRSEELLPLMRDPLLRSANALNGIFFDAVVVTESDTDRAFYDEVNHRMVAHDGDGIRDSLFLNAQNWQTTSRIIEPLRRLGVAAAGIVDADILLEEKGTAFQNLLQAAGMPESTRKSLGQLRGDLRVKLKSKADLKQRGSGAFAGSDRADFENLSRQLAAYGLFIVPGGEVESWLPNLQRQSVAKPEWLVQTFEAMGQDASSKTYVLPANDDVWEFLRGIRLWLYDPKRLGIPES